MTNAAGTPPSAEFDLGAATVSRMIATQAPEFSILPVGPPLGGWDNFTFRIGAAAAARLPRRALSVPLVRNEQRSLRHLAPFITTPVPNPLVVGRPTHFHPRPWSIVPWFDGERAIDQPLDASGAAALGRFLHNLHTAPLPSDAPVNPFRGGPLRPGREVRYRRLSLVADHVGDDVVERCQAVLESAYEVAPGSGHWIHGDLHLKNIIVAEGSPVAVIDWGDACGGDPATDVAVAWWLETREARDHFWSAYGSPDQDLRLRAAGWACHFALITWESHHEADPGFAAESLEMLRRVAAEPEFS